MEQVEENAVPQSIRQEIDDALMLLQYATANGIAVLPVVIEEILRSAAEVYPEAFDISEREFDIFREQGEPGSIDAFLARMNAERQAASTSGEGGENV